jgi:hypothetical protein
MEIHNAPPKATAEKKRRDHRVTERVQSPCDPFLGRLINRWEFVAVC